MMNEVITTINQKIREVHPQTYFERAPQNKKYPYIVFNIAGSNAVDRLVENYVLSLNFWDNKTDTEELDSLVSEVNKELNYKLIGGEGWKAILTKTSQQNIPDPNPQIRRREVLYRLRAYRV